MRRKLKLFVTLILASVAISALSGCASLVRLFANHTLDEAECREGDWRSLGYSDGAQGFPMSRFEKHLQACADFQIVPDREDYATARTQGLIAYCTPQSGYREGVNGWAYHGVCPKSKEGAFLARYREGERIYDIRSKARRMKAKIEDIYDKIADLETDLDSNRRLSKWDRRYKRDQITNYRKEKERISQNLQLFQIKHADVLSD